MMDQQVKIKKKNRVGAEEKLLEVSVPVRLLKRRKPIRERLRKLYDILLPVE